MVETAVDCVLMDIVQCNTVHYSTVLNYTVQYCTVLYYTVQYCIVLYSTVLNYTVK